MKRLNCLLVLLLITFISYGQLQEDLELFAAGKIKQYSTAGNPLANGLILTVAHPETWEVIKNDNFTEIIQRKINDYKTISLVVAVVDEKLNFPDCSDKEIEDVVLTDEFVTFFLKKGVEILSIRNIDFKNHPMQVTAAQHVNTNGTTSIMLINRFIHSGNLIEISLVYNMSLENWDNWNSDDMNYFLDLLEKVRESIVIEGSSQNMYYLNPYKNTTRA